MTGHVYNGGMEEEEVTAVEAARLTGLSDRTIRRKIKAGKLPARQIAPNRYAIKQSDLERLTGQQTGQSETLERLEAIEQRLERIESLLQAETSSKQIAPPVRVLSASHEPIQVRVTSPSDLPPGTLTLNELADELGIKRTTMIGHCKHLAHEARALQSRPGQYARFFTPEQAEQARAWHREHSKK